MRMKEVLVIGLVLLFCVGCTLGSDVHSEDPIIKGASIIAYAITFSAVVRAIFNR